MPRRRVSESEMNYHGEEYERDFLQRAIDALPLQKMGLEQYGTMMRYTCKRGTLNSVLIRPENDALHSIWMPAGATNIHSTEDYHGFTLRGVDYFIYRRPQHHVKKVFEYRRLDSISS
ncbi:MAG: hypothetical protein ACOC32_04310 [Nanoarchaeota archaeon]